MACGTHNDLGFVTCEGVHETGGERLREGVIETGLIAGDASVDARRATTRCLAYKIRIGQQRPRH